MSTVNSQENKSPDFTQLQSMIAANLAQLAKNNEKQEGSQASLAQLSQTIEEILEQVNPNSGTTKASSDKIVHVNFQEPSANPSKGPTNGQMQQAMGQMMELLAELQGKIAEYGNKNAMLSSDVGQHLMKVTAAQLKQAEKQLKEISDEQNESSFWSKFTKVAEIAVGALVAAAAILCGQPELAVIVIAFTILAASGAMDKMTQGMADEISQALVAMGVPKEDADVAAKVIADVVVILATIAITVATCGAGSAALVEEVAEDSAELGIELTNVAADSAPEAEAALENTESLAQESQSFIAKVGAKINEYNPFSKFSRTTNLAIAAGSQAVGSTNFGSDFASAVLLHVKDGKLKQDLQIAMTIVIDLMAALVGGGAAVGASASGPLYQLSNLSKVFSAFSLPKTLNAFIVVQMLGMLAQASGQIGSGVTYYKLGTSLDEQAQTQAVISALQSMGKMDNAQLDSDTKALSAKMRAWSDHLSTLITSLNQAGKAEAEILGMRA